MKFATLAFVLIVLANSTTIQDKLGELSDHPYGKSLVNLVNLNMKTGGPLQELKQLLQSVKDELIALTQLQEQEAATSTRRCQVDSAKLQATLEQAQGDLDNQRGEQSSLNSELSSLQTRVKDGIAL